MTKTQLRQSESSRIREELLQRKQEEEQRNQRRQQKEAEKRRQVEEEKAISLAEQAERELFLEIIQSRSKRTKHTTMSQLLNAESRKQDAVNLKAARDQQLEDLLVQVREARKHKSPTQTSEGETPPVSFDQTGMMDSMCNGANDYAGPEQCSWDADLGECSEAPWDEVPTTENGEAVGDWDSRSSLEKETEEQENSQAAVQEQKRRQEIQRLHELERRRNLNETRVIRVIENQRRHKQMSSSGPGWDRGSKRAPRFSSRGDSSTSSERKTVTPSSTWSQQPEDWDQDTEDSQPPSWTSEGSPAQNSYSRETKYTGFGHQPSVNVWEQRKIRQDSLTELIPNSKLDEEKMLQKAIELSQQQVEYDEHQWEHIPDGLEAKEAHGSELNLPKEPSRQVTDKFGRTETFPSKPVSREHSNGRPPLISTLPESDNIGSRYRSNGRKDEPRLYKYGRTAGQEHARSKEWQKPFSSESESSGAGDKQNTRRDSQKTWYSKRYVDAPSYNGSNASSGYRRRDNYNETDTRQPRHQLSRASRYQLDNSRWEREPRRPGRYPEIGQSFNSNTVNNSNRYSCNDDAVNDSTMQSQEEDWDKDCLNDDVNETVVEYAKPQTNYSKPQDTPNLLAKTSCETNVSASMQLETECVGEQEPGKVYSSDSSMKTDDVTSELDHTTGSSLSDPPSENWSTAGQDGPPDSQCRTSTNNSYSSSDESHNVLQCSTLSSEAPAFPISFGQFPDPEVPKKVPEQVEDKTVPLCSSKRVDNLAACSSPVLEQHGVSHTMSSTHPVASYTPPSPQTSEQPPLGSKMTLSDSDTARHFDSGIASMQAPQPVADNVIPPVMPNPMYYLPYYGTGPYGMQPTPDQSALLSQLISLTMGLPMQPGILPQMMPHVPSGMTTNDMWQMYLHQILPTMAMNASGMLMPGLLGPMSYVQHPMAVQQPISPYSTLFPSVADYTTQEKCAENNDPRSASNATDRLQSFVSTEPVIDVNRLSESIQQDLSFHKKSHQFLPDSTGVSVSDMGNATYGNTFLGHYTMEHAPEIPSFTSTRKQQVGGSVDNICNVKNAVNDTLSSQSTYLKNQSRGIRHDTVHASGNGSQSSRNRLESHTSSRFPEVGKPLDETVPMLSNPSQSHHNAEERWSNDSKVVDNLSSKHKPHTRKQADHLQPDDPKASFTGRNDAPYTHKQDARLLGDSGRSEFDKSKTLPQSADTKSVGAASKSLHQGGTMVPQDSRNISKTSRKLNTLDVTHLPTSSSSLQGKEPQHAPVTLSNAAKANPSTSSHHTDPRLRMRYQRQQKAGINN